jgi:hypothetical protein
MLSKEELDTLSDFFLDGAKILFGSLVVGVFVPTASGKVPWLTFVVGIGMTLVFLAVAGRLSKLAKAEK